MTELEDLLGLYQRLPDNRYRIYLIMEDGNARLIVDVAIRDGKPVDPSAVEDELPERPAIRDSIVGQQPAEDASGDDGNSQAPVPPVSSAGPEDVFRMTASPAAAETLVEGGDDQSIEQPAASAVPLLVAGGALAWRKPPSPGDPQVVARQFKQRLVFESCS